MDTALNYLQETKVEVKAEDVARLSPLGQVHINILGRYHFDLSEAVLKGETRPLRDLSAVNASEEVEE